MEDAEPDQNPVSTVLTLLGETQSESTVQGASTEENGQESQDPKAPLIEFDWSDLEQRYLVRMKEFDAEEQLIYEEFSYWIKIFEAWADTAMVHENERALKRLKTRIRFVQMDEARLEEKRQHYVKVVEAFQSALALLSAS